MTKKLLPSLLLFLCWLGLSGAARANGLPPTGRPLAAVLNPDGTLLPGATGSFDARQFRMNTAPDGRPVFSPASTSGTGDERWQDGLGLNGAERRVNTVVRSGNDIYVGGAFRLIGNIVANYVAKWNGTAWSSLGTGPANGTNSEVLTLAVAPNGDVYASGLFSLAGNTPADGIAKWNGTAWSALGTSPTGGLDGFAYALAVAPNGDLYAGGTITQAGGLPANGVARWNGTAWSALGTGVSLGSASGRPVSALAVAPNGDVYAGGSFTEAGGLPANGLARWDGTAWNILGTSAANGTNGGVLALAIGINGDLYVGGSFTQAGAVPANNVARWNGTAWSALGTGVANAAPAVVAMGVAPNGDLYIGGNLTQVGGATVSRVARWNGTAWSAVGTPPANAIGTTINALAVAGNGDVYAASTSANTIAGAAAYYLLRWNGAAWNTVSTGLNGVFGLTYNPAINAMTTAANGDVYAAGELRMAGSAVVSGVARWNGTAWSAVGPATANINNTVRAVAVAANGDVYIGGIFTQIGTAAISYVARWNGTAWSALGTGSSLNNSVNALVVASNGDVYAGGTFTQAGNAGIGYVARWNGIAWSPLGTGTANGVNGPVGALALAGNGDLYVGGAFDNASGIIANNVARWNGTAWSALGAGPANGVNAFVDALAVAGSGEVYAGGGFAQAGGVPASRVARWNGTAWGALGAGAPTGTNGEVYTLGVAGNGEVYVGGNFTQFDGIAAARVARWTGTAWSPLGTGLNNLVTALTIGTTGKVYFGGSFTAVGDGSKVLSRFAIYDPNAPLLVARAAAPSGFAALFPNPAHGRATLRLPAGAPQQPITLSNALGQTVRRYPAPTTTEPALDLRGLPAGTYVVRCGQFSQRLVVE
ncbi:T9SS type A sorting domain-containing protein [Hymenobacter convexus]|uniref:T9SS type A sorting domain-containing protein n=1 Tax=Hymenobacter sp. CA1UV-4 TaxID=3063782 RepID=UPI0027143517|nr:T9SS type A sorting domain-containing protein [Hymenobacter sp. CA1UV-4]MDO7854264.1 T9SS type A sorting domain-containing protein [Hymenobacter sp. CA1UV-4]